MKTFCFGLVLVGVLGISSLLPAQSLPCPARDRNAEALELYLGATASDSTARGTRVRQRLSMSAGNISQVVIQTDSTVCGRVTRAVETAFGWQALTQSLLVARYGSTYFAYVPGTNGGLGMVFVVDSTFAYKTSITAF